MAAFVTTNQGKQPRNANFNENTCDPVLLRWQRRALVFKMTLTLTAGINWRLTTFSLLVICFLGNGGLSLGSDQERPISFNRDIRPILSDKCFHCHGPNDESREADLRFDIKEDAFHVIEIGNLEESELIRRITDEDPDSRMPPAEINKPLSVDEIEILKKWVQQGAPWSEFWAYVPPHKYEPPILKSNARFGNWIDQFTVARLEEYSLGLSAPADRTTLLRRLYFDLIGLPPTPAQVNAFLQDQSPLAFENVVDQLLASKHFGERLAIYWLDLVRFADTVGYHGDQPHNISPYRDWVINAFNENMPFDQFTREQLAGDLLPNSTESQKIASGYNRLLQTTHEGGLQPKEYSAIYAADRVRNVSLVWMGATVGCAQCHDHKYDPYTMKDFYSLAAFFADVDDEQHFKVGTNSTPTKRPPEILVISDKDRVALETAKAQTDAQSTKVNQLKEDVAKLKQELEGLGKSGLGKSGLVDELDKTVKSAAEPGVRNKPINQQTEAVLPDAIVADEEDRNAELIANLQSRQSQVAREENQLKQLIRDQSEIESRGAWTMITQPLPAPRIMRVLRRGHWMDETGEIVQPSVPGFMGAIETDSKRATRLDLANWLTDESRDSGQLTARVFANRFWYLFMGVGISRSLDDFGGQGEPPANPELLDNLAIEFIDNDWDVKHLIRRIVTSKTYQQSSLESPEIRRVDPYNQLFSHQSRYRLPAELIRDNALSISGLLNVDQIGGTSVKPAQPANYYQHLNFPQRKYIQDTDDRQWRRGVYVHWQRMFLHPSLKAFDAPTREECTAQRPKSNTPSAALALLNDPIFVEAARMFAARILATADSDSFSARIDRAYHLALSRSPDRDEFRILEKLYNDCVAAFEQDPGSATNLLAIGQAKPKASTEIDPTKLAAWTTVARAILNLNETNTRN